MMFLIELNNIAQDADFSECQVIAPLEIKITLALMTRNQRHRYFLQMTNNVINYAN